MTDPYFKSRPREPTPATECCGCEQLDAVYLAHEMADEPIYCTTCRGEVAPERIGFIVIATRPIQKIGGCIPGTPSDGVGLHLRQDPDSYSHYR